MALLHPAESKFVLAWPPADWLDVTVLVCLSGGADSVALLRLATAVKTAHRGSKGRLVAAHLNHQLRGGDSDADEAFVADLCRRLGVWCIVKRAGVGRLAADRRDGLEAAARSARYHFFRQAAGEAGARYVVTAHTADDQAETILHRIIRGTGISGLSGMARARPLGPATLIRPLLTFRRAELLSYLADLSQPYRVDQSNADTRFTRNRIRHELLPALAQRFNPGVVEVLLRLGSLAGEVQGVIEGIVAELAERCVTEQGPESVLIDAGPLAGQPPYVVRELLKAAWRSRGWPLQAMGLVHWDLLCKMLAPPGPHSAPPVKKHVFPGRILAEASGGQLRLSRIAS